MALINQDFEIVKKEKIDEKTLNVDCLISGNLGLKKILAVSGEVTENDIDVSDGKCNLSGVIGLCAIFINENDEVSTECMTFPWTYELQDEKISSTCHEMIKTNLKKCNIKSASINEIKVECEICFNGYVVKPYNVSSVKSDDVNTACKEDEIKVVKFIGCCRTKLIEELKGNAKNGIKKIICTKSEAVLKNVESGVNFVSVSGEIETDVVFANNDDRFETMTLSDTFKDEIELDGINRNSIVEAKVCVINNETKVDIEESDKTFSITITLPLCVKVCAYREESLKVIKDIYSTKCELELSTSSFDMLSNVKSGEFESKFSGGLTLSEEEGRIDKILFVSAGSLEITNSYLEGNEIYLEGIANATVVYLNDDTNSIKSVEISSPFVVSDKTNATGNNFDFDVCLTDLDVSVKKGRELSLDAKIKGFVIFSDSEISAVISNIIEGEVFEDRDYAMELFFAKAGQSAWDIAKSAKVKEETVIYQNPEITFPLEQNEKILLYFQKTHN